MRRVGGIEVRFEPDRLSDDRLRKVFGVVVPKTRRRARAGPAPEIVAQPTSKVKGGKTA